MTVAFRFLLILGAMFVLDQTTPQLVRTFATGLLPWGNREAVDAFNERYGRVGFPRTVFLLIACLCVAFFSDGSPTATILLAAGLASVVLWMAFAGIDIWKAAKASGPQP